MNSLELRKRLLLAESELNRAQLAIGLRAFLAGCDKLNCFADMATRDLPSRITGYGALARCLARKL
jgi:hypothetical protein